MLPGSVPSMIAAVKVNGGLTLVGVIVDEFQSATAGLGYLISYGSQSFQMNLVMTSIVILAILSAVLLPDPTAGKTDHRPPRDEAS